MKQLSKEQLARIKQILLVEQQNILGSSSARSDHKPEMNLETLHEQAQTLRLGLVEREQLRRIQGALKRLNNGLFGTCQSCRNQISLARLEARPVSLFCFECKLVQESRAQHHTPSQPKDPTWADSPQFKQTKPGGSLRSSKNR